MLLMEMGSGDEIIRTFPTMNADILKALSGVIQARREFLRLSQEELAQRADLHRTYISDIERGARNLSLRSLCRLANALEIPASGLLHAAESKISVDPSGSDNESR